MIKKWVVADHHFAHANIIPYCRRPFSDVNKMDAELVKLHNSVVDQQDKVYFIGDITLKTAEKWQWLQKILSRMNGTKHLVYGNHDDWHWETYLKAGFQTVHSYLEIRQDTPTVPRGTLLTQPISLCHDPAWAQDKSKLWICGHLHNCAFTAPTHIAIVSVELTEYKPVLLNDIVDGYRPGEGVPRIPPRIKGEIK